MNWSSPPRNVPAHIGRFAEQLRELSLEVRASMASLTGDAVGRAVRDVLLRFWHTSPQRPRPERRERYAWERDEWDRDERERDEWNRDDRWEKPEVRLQPPASSSITVPRLALLLQVGGWLLECSPWLLLLAGLGIGGVVLFKGDLNIAGFDAINGITDVASLIALLTSGAKHLGSR
jgi:hypothetical protein